MVDIVLYHGKNRSDFMPQMRNVEKNILLEINLLNNSRLDIKTSRSDIENWVPFTFLLTVPQEQYVYDEEARTTFTLYEIKMLISELQKIIQLKESNQNFETFKFFNLEANIGLIIYDPLEKNELGIEIWINIGSYSNGKICGFNKGYSFEVLLSSIDQFTNQLKQQLYEVITRSEEGESL